MPLKLLTLLALLGLAACDAGAPPPGGMAGGTDADPIAEAEEEEASPVMDDQPPADLLE